MICWEHTAVKSFGACCLPGFGTAFWKSVEDGVIPKNPCLPWSCFFLRFSKEVSLPGLLWRVLFISMWLKGEEVVWVLSSLPGRALGCLAGSPHDCLAPTHGTSTVVSAFCSAKGSYRVIHHSCICFLASPCHLVLPVTIKMLLFITNKWYSVPGVMTLQLQIFGICFSCLRALHPFFWKRDSSPFTWALT